MLLLLADDDADTLGMLSEVLRAEGYLVGTAVDGVELIEVCVASAAAGHPPRVIVTDIDMPRCDGLEAVRELRRRALDIPAVFVTGHRESEIVSEAQTLGVALLYKPLDLAELKRRLAGILAAG